MYSGQALRDLLLRERTKIMYKKAIGLLLLGNVILISVFLCMRDVEAAGLAAQPMGKIHLDLEDLEPSLKEEYAEGAVLAAGKSALEADKIFKNLGIGELQVSVSGQRVVDYQVMESWDVWNLSQEDREVLLRIVEAEAGSEDEDGRLLVANVVLNRVASDKFPDTVPEVVFQQGKGVTQFSPVASGSYYRVKVSEKTVAAVERALKGEDISEGALYFAARRYASDKKMRWFDEKLTFLFQHGGHEFFK